MGLISQAILTITNIIENILTMTYDFFYSTIGIGDTTISLFLGLIVLYTPIIMLLNIGLNNIYSTGRIILIEVFMIILIVSITADNNTTIDMEIKITAWITLLFLFIGTLKRIFLAPILSRFSGSAKETD